MVATDMSECATMAESRAAMLCQQLGKSRLDIINVQDLSIIDMLTRVLKSSSSDTEDAVRESMSGDLAQVATRLENKYRIPCERLIRFGNPVAEIMKEIVARGTGLLIFWGISPANCSRSAPCPCLSSARNRNGLTTKS